MIGWSCRADQAATVAARCVAGSALGSGPGVRADGALSARTLRTLVAESEGPGDGVMT